MPSVTRARVLESLERAKTCGECRDGILRHDSLHFDLDREDEEQLCPAQIHKDVPDFAAALIEAMDALKESCTHSYRCICVGCELIRRFEGAE